MLRRWPRAVGLVLLGSAWIVLCLLPAFAASEGNNHPPSVWFYLLVLAGPVAVALRAYLAGRASGRSKVGATAVAVGLGAAAVIAAPLAFGLLIWGLTGFST